MLPVIHVPRFYQAACARVNNVSDRETGMDRRVRHVAIVQAV